MPKMPDMDEDESPNLTDTNGAAGAMDEDGEEDASPTVQGMAVKFTHPPGTSSGQTEIVAQVHTPYGVMSKRTVYPGHLTANKLAEVLLGIARW